jgi:hypothetical protein
MGMSERFVSLDPWASRQPRRRDLALLASGATASLGAIAWAVLLPVAPAAVATAPMSAARMQQIEAETRQLNTQVGRLEQPWPGWLRAILLELPAGTGVLQLDIDPQQGRVKLVLDAGDFAAVEAAIARLEAGGLFDGLRAMGHDRDAEGRLRAVVEGRLADPGVSGKAVARGADARAMPKAQQR